MDAQLTSPIQRLSVSALPCAPSTRLRPMNAPDHSFDNGFLSDALREVRREVHEK